MHSEAFIRLVASKAFRGYAYNHATHRISTPYTLGESQVRELIDLAIKDFGYPHQQAAREAIEDISYNPPELKPAYTPGLEFADINPGDLLYISGADGWLLHLLCIQPQEWAVLSDNTAMLRPGDVLRPLQLQLTAGNKLVAALFRNGLRYPDDEQFLCVHHIAKIGRRSAAESPAGSVEISRQAESGAMTVYANAGSDDGTGFADWHLTDDPHALFEIDLQRLRYRFNKNFNRENPPRDALDQLSRLGECDEDNPDNILRILPGDDGILSPVRQGNNTYLTITRKCNFYCR